MKNKKYILIAIGVSIFVIIAAVLIALLVTLSPASKQSKKKNSVIRMQIIINLFFSLF